MPDLPSGEACNSTNHDKIDNFNTYDSQYFSKLYQKASLPTACLKCNRILLASRKKVPTGKNPNDYYKMGKGKDVWACKGCFDQEKDVEHPVCNRCFCYDCFPSVSAAFKASQATKVVAV